jgi:hypothetical protein
MTIESGDHRESEVEVDARDAGAGPSQNNLRGSCNLRPKKDQEVGLFAYVL